MTNQSINNKPQSLPESQSIRNLRKIDNNSLLYRILVNKKINSNRKFLSIIIPVYNEEKTIRNLLESLPSGDKIEIVVVDDDSIDTSLSEIKEARYNGNIKIIKHKFNQGYGMAILTGIRHAKGEIFVTMDSDGQHKANDIINLVKPILEKRADITIGSRYKGSYNYRLPISTRLGEAILEVIIQLFFRQKIKNNQGGFRGFHRKTINIFNDVRFKGYAFTTELLLAAGLKGYKIMEVPINLSNRAHGSSYIILRKLLLALVSCLSIYFFKKVKGIVSNMKSHKSFSILPLNK